MPAPHEAAEAAHALEAEENLRVIRSLMEKATVYRALSAPGALVGGVLSVATASAGAFLCGDPNRDEGLLFVTPWMFVFCATAIVNGFLLWRDAGRRGDVFLSAGMKLVLSAMFPGMAAGGLCVLIDFNGGTPVTASVWVLCYGVGLLAAAPFAPGSIRWLGRLFFVAGAALLVSGCWFFEGWRVASPARDAHLIMGATFGLFHLVYAACTWPRGTRAATHVSAQAAG